MSVCKNYWTGHLFWKLRKVAEVVGRRGSVAFSFGLWLQDRKQSEMFLKMTYCRKLVWREMLKLCDIWRYNSFEPARLVGRVGSKCLPAFGGKWCFVLRGQAVQGETRLKVCHPLCVRSIIRSCIVYIYIYIYIYIHIHTYSHEHKNITFSSNI